MVTPDDFKHVMRRWASTVTIITTRAGDTIHGLTATSFSSLSANPPEVFVCINKSTRTHPLIEQAGNFCVNFLTEDMKAISDRFAGRTQEVDRFHDLSYRAEVTGAPVLNDALAWLDCSIDRALDTGDHTIFIGLVKATGVQHDEHTPLLYMNGRYRGVGNEI